MKYYVIAGEASGDLHGANFIKALKQLDANAEIRAWGGDLMSSAGADVVKHYRDLAFMGFLEVVKNLGTIRKNFDFCKKDILDFNPDTVVFIDYPGFNLRMAKWAKGKRFRTQYYISPTIWAWNTGRVHKVKAYVDQMFTILPFEHKFYEKYDYPAQFVGHPLLDAVDQADFKNISTASEKKCVALLPGSRGQELEKILPVFAEIVKCSPQYHFIIAAVPWQPISLYEQHFDTCAGNIQVEVGRTYDVLSSADLAIVTSGTATLETALFNVPQVVVYKTSFITYTLAKRFAKVKHISLPNLILEEGLVDELIQDDCTADNILNSLQALEHHERAASLKAGYEKLHAKLGDVGASQRVAQAVYEDVVKNTG